MMYLSRDETDALNINFEGDPQKATGVGYVSHFSTCHNADQHRRR